MEKTSKTILECHKIASRVSEVEIPYKVWTALHENQLSVFIHGTDVCLGSGDYKSITEAREAIAWYVEQLGGKVKWSKE